MEEQGGMNTRSQFPGMKPYWTRFMGRHVSVDPWSTLVGYDT